MGEKFNRDARKFARTSILIITCLLVVAALVAPASMSAQTAAGTAIGNQASATYTDSSSVSRTATSNVVTTIVQQVASLTLTANGAKTASPGSPVFYPHTLTNTGNGSDSFSLTLAPAQSGAPARCPRAPPQDRRTTFLSLQPQYSTTPRLPQILIQPRLHPMP